jgi:ABC-type Fe3+/spermidine/putrescine transport system ATPase subunit
MPPPANAGCGHDRHLQLRAAMGSQRAFEGRILFRGRKIQLLKTVGMKILLVEQNVGEALDLADRGYVIQTGRIVGQGTGRELLAKRPVRQAFLGI